MFVDLAGFTALTEMHGDEQAADLAEQFVSMTRQTIGPDDRLIKSIGDAVMFTAPGPDAALSSLARLMRECRASASFPIPRAGLHHGPVAERGDDIFGTSVNLAARVAGQAAAGEVLGTEGIAAAARDAGIFAASIGSVQLRNLASAVELFEIHLIEVDADSFTVDPVCRMRVEPSHAAGWLRHGGSGWWFCSLECASTFVQDPDTYADMNN